MIIEHPRKGQLRPVGNDLCLMTWRNEPEEQLDRQCLNFQYPTEGCHGAPLEQDYPNRRNTP